MEDHCYTDKKDNSNNNKGQFVKYFNCSFCLLTLKPLLVLEEYWRCLLRLNYDPFSLKYSVKCIMVLQNISAFIHNMR